ncbi:MAG: hypothetical protein E7463_07795 [Ruminococcaceae bacterium]|nr:hypothetical protein [Oscillospiraceae bacterium]
MTSTLKVGIGRQDITPPLGTMLQGYTPVRPAESIGDRLNLTAYAFESDGVRAIVATADVCLIKDPLSSELRRAMADASGVPFEHIILSATHTHSGPLLNASNDDLPDAAYIRDILTAGAAKAAAGAVGTLRPALVGIGEVKSDVGINRRQIRRDGTIGLGQDPHGTYDPIMTVVSFREPDGKPIGNLIHYGAHNTASGKNPEISRDWCGVAIDRLEAVSGGITAFFNGCEGDTGPRLPNGGTTGNYQMAQELGGRAAIDAVNAWRSIKEWRADLPVKALTGTIDLPLKNLPDEQTLEQEIESLGDPDKLVGLAITSYHHLLSRLELIRSGESLPTAEAISTTVISVGPIVFLACPFEVFSRITLRIREFSPYPYTLTLSNGNGNLFYFPSQDQICRGGYEVWLFTSFKVHPFADDSEQYYVDGAIDLLEQLKES